MAARRKKSEKKSVKKSEAEKAIEAARAAGAQYAQDQLQTELFHDWVWDQMIEGEAMRQRDPDSVIPLATKRDYDVLAGNMLDMLRHDIDRGLDHREVVELVGTDDKDAVSEFWTGLHDELRRPEVRSWLADELLAPMQEEVAAKRPAQTPPEQMPLPHVRGGPRQRTRETPRSSIEWKPSGGSTGFAGRGASGQTYLLRKTGDEKWNLHIDGQRHGPYAHLDWAKAEAERNERMRRSGGQAAPQTWSEPRLRERQGVEDYVAVDTRNRVIAGPFKDYSKAKTEADRAGGHVRFVMDRGPTRPLREDPRDQGYDPDSQAGPRNFPRLRRVQPSRSR